MLLDILEEHLDEAQFLFGQRLHALRSLSLGPAYLASVDERLAAQIDGLVVGGSEAWKLCAPLLEGQSGEGSFAATLVALESGQRGPLADVEAALLAAPEPGLAGAAWAFCLSASPSAREAIERWGDAAEGALRAVALEVSSFRRRVPTAALLRAWSTNEPSLVRAALRAAGRMRIGSALPEVVARLSVEDAPTRADALEALALLDTAHARQEGRSLLAREGAGAEVGARVLGLVGHIEDLPALEAAARSTNLSVSRAALVTLGNLGFSEALPLLLESLEIGARARAAGFALRRLLGPDAAWRITAASTGDDEEVWLAGEDLPLWSAREVRDWWSSNKGKFVAGRRYRCGAPFVAQAPREASACAVRRFEAEEEALASPGMPLQETRGWLARAPFAWAKSMRSAAEPAIVGTRA